MSRLLYSHSVNSRMVDSLQMKKRLITELWDAQILLRAGDIIQDSCFHNISSHLGRYGRAIAADAGNCQGCGPQ